MHICFEIKKDYRLLRRLHIILLISEKFNNALRLRDDKDNRFSFARISYLLNSEFELRKVQVTSK